MCLVTDMYTKQLTFHGDNFLASIVTSSQEALLMDGPRLYMSTSYVDACAYSDPQMHNIVV